MISIIVPVYNVEKWLDCCIESIINQTYKDIEIILVDDGSTDNSGKICDNWAEKDERIVVVHKENGGLSDARNAGIDKASGEWIVFVDSDDFVHKDMAKISFEAAVKYNADLVAFGYLRVPEDCNEEISKLTEEKEELFVGQKLLYEYLYNRKGDVVAWNKLYRREIWSTLRYPVGKIHEDEFVIVDVLQSVNKSVVLDKVLYYYRQREGSIVNEKELKAAYDALEAFELRYDKLKSDKVLGTRSLTIILKYIINIYNRENSKCKKRELLKKYRDYFFKDKKGGISWKGWIALMSFAISPTLYGMLVKEKI